MDAAAYRDLVLEIVRRSDARVGFKVLPRRWVVERTFPMAAVNVERVRHRWELMSDLIYSQRPRCEWLSGTQCRVKAG